VTAPPLIGRRPETAWLADAADAALAGVGSLVLLAGEAGVGKTHLAEAAFAGRPLLRGAAQAPAAAPYGPVVAALRWRLREDPSALDGCGHLRAHLALLLPELAAPRDPAAPADDRGHPDSGRRHRHDGGHAGRGGESAAGGGHAGHGGCRTGGHEIAGESRAAARTSGRRGATRAKSPWIRSPNEG